MMMIPGTLLAIITYVTPNLIESLQLWPSAYSSPQTFQALPIGTMCEKCLKCLIWKCLSISSQCCKMSLFVVFKHLVKCLKHTFCQNLVLKYVSFSPSLPYQMLMKLFFLQNNQREAELRKWLDLCFLAAGSEWHYYIRGKIARVTYFPSIIMVHEIFGVFLYTRNVNSLVKNDQKSERSTKTFIIFIDKKALKKLNWFLFSSWLNFGVANTVCY